MCCVLAHQQSTAVRTTGTCTACAMKGDEAVLELIQQSPHLLYRLRPALELAARRAGAPAEAARVAFERSACAWRCSAV